MRIIKNKQVAGIVATILILLFSSIFYNINAIAKKGFTLSPMQQRILLVPGESYKGSISIHNPATSDENFKYLVTVSPFYTTGTNNGNDDYGGVDYSTKSNMNMIADWTDIENDSGVIKPNEEAIINFIIDVPEDAPAGGQYMALMVRENRENEEIEDSMAVTEIMQMAHNVYAEVAGETRQEGVVLENNIPSFLLSSPLETASMVKNSGNVHTDASYILQVWPLFSEEEICTNEENPSESLVLPETEKYHTESCQLPAVGIFRAKQTVKIFGEESIVEKTIIVCPIWLLFIIVFIVFALIFYFIAKSKARKKASQKANKTAQTTN